MALSDHMSENISNNGQLGSWSAPPQWEPDHEPPMDGKPDGTDVGTHCCSETSRPVQLPALDGLRQQSPPPANPPNPLAPLNHHNQLTRFLSKQTLGYIPKLSVRSPERTMSPPGVYGGMPREGGAFTFTESPRSDNSLTSPSIRLPSLSGTPPLSPQKWSASPFFSRQDDAPSSEGRPSLPSFGPSSGMFPTRTASLSDGCSSPIPPLKRAHNETLHPMSIADLCQPFRYMRSQSCPSDTQNVDANAPATKAERPESASPETNWRPSLEPQTYIRTQSCHGDAEAFKTHAPVSAPSSLEEELQRNRLQHSSSMDAPLVLATLSHKRSAAESIDLHQWLDRPSRGSLSSLADSADSMHQLEQAGQLMRISDSPRSDAVAPSDAKREKKLCAFPQCASNAVTRGLCISHGGGRRCQRKGCTRGAQSKGLCVAHGGGRICRATGCSNIQRSMGLCIRHGGGRRCRVKGCQKGVVRQDLCTAHGGKRKCRVPECMKHVKKKGLCRSHANSMYAASGSS
ncbi:hypothetical protein PHYBOEH_002171 [Phytophthora boehmeriae]|uniref:WRKY19-like zinc finger domain-containing protein n=1 Tax=Phytophthora boehmeriae TaxID=109152 RepID=A0A8T1WWA7_9STRA|nr:hypothetical protein PHYBOEH_002171 [Phytophthora boehmeriae]